MDRKSFLYEILDPESQQLLKETFTIDPRKNFIKCDGFSFPPSFEKFADKIRNMEIRDDDVWICTFAKSGTTWVSEMTWCIQNGLTHNDVQKSISDRLPFLEASIFLDFFEGKNEAEDSIDRVIKLPSPRYIKTHLPFNLLPEKLQNFSTNAKIIHIARNPRDTVISYYHHCRLLGVYKGTFEQFAELFLNGSLPYTPFPAHLNGYLAHGENPKILFLKFEDMKKDLKQSIESTCKFFGKSISETEKETLLDHLSFSSMKKNPAVNYQSDSKRNNDDEGHFMRRGIVGDWKDKLDVELCRRFEEWEKRYLPEIDFYIYYLNVRDAAA